MFRVRTNEADKNKTMSMFPDTHVRKIRLLIGIDKLY